jgi:hypothetical protein
VILFVVVTWYIAAQVIKILKFFFCFFFSFITITYILPFKSNFVNNFKTIKKNLFLIIWSQNSDIARTWYGIIEDLFPFSLGDLTGVTHHFIMGLPVISTVTRAWNGCYIHCPQVAHHFTKQAADMREVSPPDPLPSPYLMEPAHWSSKWGGVRTEGGTILYKNQLLFIKQL